MKQALLMLGSLVLAAALSTAAYSDTLSGSQTATPEANGIALNLTASGDLPGMNKVTLQRNNLNVTGGSWHMTVLPQNADASSNSRGELIGTVSGGTLTLTAEGTLASASGVQVVIQSGTGEFASVTSGTATITITANAETPTQLNGTLVLNF
jgi:outer membrane lipoprotein SlyB